MKTIRALLRDRRRSQHGGVLSGVLIITAFLAIIAGALMTELSTNFILSRNMLNQSFNEATVNSAMELALNQLETNPISGGCPSLDPAQVGLNGRLAVSSYQTCWPAYREKLYNPIASSAAFTASGSHSVLPAASPAQDLYVVGDSVGNVYQFPFGSTNENWTYQVPGGVTGPPVTVPDLASGQNALDMMTLVPFSTGGNPPSGCTASAGCVGMLAEDTDRTPLGPDVFCYMAASDKVTSSAAMGVNYSTVAFFADLSGAVYAYAASEKTVPCPQKAKSTSNQQAVVAGPFVFAGPANVDEVYVVTSNSVLRYTYTEPQNQSPKLTLAGTLPLTWSGVVGVALEKTSLPARLAITFANGHVAVVQLASSFAMSVAATAAVPTSIQGAATWSHNPSLNPADQIAVGGTNGILYLFDTSLNQIASLGAAGAQVLTGLASDSVGEWFYGDSAGYVHEIQRLSGPTMTEVATFGPVAGGIGSVLQVGPCSGMICLYVATQGGNAYRVPLDARDVVMTACISDNVPTCSGANPRLWTTIEVGREGFPNEVHVRGWSYYSA